uniref:dTTP/UTP pyrophosphatase n=5 Tax=unclassified Prevotella TaxID=2638335 RepID=A0AB33JMS6_9BACT
MKYNLILASNSPRRKELLAGLNIPFQVMVKSGIDESYPQDIAAEEVPLFLSRKKAAAYIGDLAADDLLLTADTVVILDNQILGKPHDAKAAKEMLRYLSGRKHLVVTGVSLTSLVLSESFKVVSEVTFKTFTSQEIDYYVEQYHPMDKAGAYGIQEWIGYIGVTALSGSYYNVMGLPVQRIYQVLCEKFDFSLPYSGAIKP